MLWVRTRCHHVSLNGIALSIARQTIEDSQSKRLRMDVAGPNCSHTTTANQYVRPQVLMAWVTGQGWLGRGST